MQQELQSMVQQDLILCKEIWQKYSYDWEELSALFFWLLQKYHGKIEGFDKDLCVMQDRESSVEAAEVCRYNIKLLMHRLEMFLENKCSNDGLLDSYIQKEQKQIDFQANFTSVRLSLGMMDLPQWELDEIMRKLDDMEEICARVVPRSKKWEALREYLVWLSGKHADIGMLILPLFFRINDKIAKEEGKHD